LTLKSAEYKRKNKKNKKIRKGSRKILHNSGDMIRTLGYRIDGDVLKIGFLAN